MPERRDDQVLPTRQPAKQAARPPAPSGPSPSSARAQPRSAQTQAPARSETSQPSAGPATSRKATLRLVEVEPWSVMKTAFLLSIAAGIVAIVAVTVVWGVLGAAGLWDSVNTIVQDSLGDKSGAPFDVRDYVGTSRVLGFTMLVAAADVILLTAIATLGAFLYNLAATLLGGIQVTFTEDK